MFFCDEIDLKIFVNMSTAKCFKYLVNNWLRTVKAYLKRKTMSFYTWFYSLIPVYSESLNNLYNVYFNTNVWGDHIFVLHLNSMFTMSVYTCFLIYTKNRFAWSYNVINMTWDLLLGSTFCQKRFNVPYFFYLSISVDYVPCGEQSVNVNVTVITDACVEGGCSKHGECINFLNGHVLFTTCACDDGMGYCIRIFTRNYWIHYMDQCITK